MIGDLLNRLQKVRKTGADKWVACCPAHEDKSPSLAIRAVEDGRILIHCFAGCEPLDILGAIGLDMNDLFAERLGDLPRIAKPYTEKEVLIALRWDLSVITCAAVTMALGRTLEPLEHDLLIESVKKVEDGTRYAHGL